MKAIETPGPVGPVQQTVVLQQSSGEPGCLIQILWWLFIGWWLGAMAISLAWFLNVTIIGLPLGMAILNNIPKILALQNPTKWFKIAPGQDLSVVTQTDLPQYTFWLRAAFFLFIGWWWSGIWLAAAYFFCFIIILMPVGFLMFRLAPAMTTLRRY
jgi:uncharacterized membrane protein YccF (DUF307 family)